MKRKDILDQVVTVPLRRSAGGHRSRPPAERAARVEALRLAVERGHYAVDPYLIARSLLERAAWLQRP